jgi:oxygen-independent coproporphyrinogen-3 oxidase
VEGFLRAFATELARAAKPPRPATVFVGGGTPTELTEAELERFLHTLTGGAAIGPGAEFTVEANPESVTPGKARLLEAAGVNRVSLGAQSFDDERLRFLERPHDAAAIERAFRTFREAGFTNQSIDLIFGLPGQTVPEWDRDLTRALALEPEHISCYNLTFEPGTRFYAQMTKGRIRPNDPERDRDLFLHTRSRLADAGLPPYEISNFARPGRACRHNVNYWNAGDYLGLGPGAASHRGGTRTTNVRPVELYARLLDSGLPATESAETLAPAARLAEAAWLGLRLTEGFSLRGLSSKFGLPADQRLAGPIARFTAGGFLETADSGDRVRLTAEGLLFADLVSAAMLETAEPAR